MPMERFVGETVKVRLKDVIDTAGDFVVSLGGGESMTYQVLRNGSATSSGSLTYDTDTAGDWRAFAALPTDPGLVKIAVTAVVDGATRKYTSLIEVKVFP